MLRAPSSQSHRAVHYLPNEVLSEIFLLVQTFSPWRKWLPVLWVCRRWSAVSRGAALLWCEIAIERKPNNSFIAASLEYSQNTYLTVHFYHADYFSETLCLLSPHTRRIRTLKIFSTTDTVNGDLAIFLGHDFPSLELFEENSSLTRLPWTWRSDGSSYPRLRHLALGGDISIEIAPTAVFAALRTLHLGNDGNPSFTLPSFIQFLSRHLHLEELNLSQYNLVRNGLFTALTFPPTIRRLTLTDKAGYIKRFLSSFTHIPAHVSLFITYHRDSVGGDSALFITRGLPDPPQCYLPILSRASSIKVTGIPHYQYTLIGTSVARHGSVTPFIQFGIPFFHARSQELANAADVFSRSPITEVRLVGNSAMEVPSQAFRAAEWVPLLDVLPLLEHIAIEDATIGEKDARKGILKALLKPGPDARARCPRLKRLTLWCADPPATRDRAFFMDLLPRVLQSRALQDAMVEELCLLFEPVAGAWSTEDRDRLVSGVEAAPWRRFVNDVRVDFVSEQEP